MGLPLELIAAIVFLLFYELEYHEQCHKFKSVFYKRYVDDVFVLFDLAKNLSKFHPYLNTCHGNMPFSFEQTKGKLSF